MFQRGRYWGVYTWIKFNTDGHFGEIGFSLSDTGDGYLLISVISLSVTSHFNLFLVFSTYLYDVVSQLIAVLPVRQLKNYQ